MTELEAIQAIAPYVGVEVRDGDAWPSPPCGYEPAPVGLGGASPGVVWWSPCERGSSPPQECLRWAQGAGIDVSSCRRVRARWRLG